MNQTNKFNFVKIINIDIKVIFPGFPIWLVNIAMVFKKLK